MTSLKTKTISLSIDSLFRKDYYNTTSSDFNYTLPSPIKNIVKMSITAIEIPNFWYQYSSADRTNEFKITTYNYVAPDPEDSNLTMLVDSTEYTIVLPDGNYNNVDIVTFLMNYFVNTGGGLAFLVVSIDVNSGKTIFRARHPTDDPTLPAPYDSKTPYYSPLFYYTLDFQTDPDRPIYRNLGWSLGFINPTYTASCSKTYTSKFLAIQNTKSITYNAYIASESVFGSSYYNYVFLDIDDNNSSFSNDGIICGLTDSYMKGNNIIARVTITTASNSVNLTTAADFVFKTREYYGPVTISDLYIRILNRYGDVVNLNGNDFSFLIEFTVLEQ